MDPALEAAVLGLEVATALIILGGAARVAWLAVRRAGLREMRVMFAGTLLLALDFAIGADVLRVALAPGLDAVLMAALVVLARIGLTFILLYELRQEAGGA